MSTTNRMFELLRVRGVAYGFYGFVAIRGFVDDLDTCTSTFIGFLAYKHSPKIPQIKMRDTQLSFFIPVTHCLPMDIVFAPKKCGSQEKGE